MPVTLQSGQLINVGGAYGRIERFPQPHIATVPTHIAGQPNPDATPKQLAAATLLFNGSSVIISSDRYYVTVNHDRKKSALKLTPASGP